MEEIFVPASGMAMEEALLTEWLKQEGEPVAPGEVIALVETDKSVVELSAGVEGTLSRHLVEAGARVPGGTTVAFVLQAGDSEPAGAAQDQGRGPDAGGHAASSTTAQQAQAGTEAPAPPSSEGTEGRHRLSPRQRREMAQSASASPVDVDPSPVTEDVAPPASNLPVGAAPIAGAPIAAAPAGSAPSAPDSAQSSNREATAALVTQSWRAVPHFSVGLDIRADGLRAGVEAARRTGAPATVTDFLLLALSQALTAEGQEADVGLAVATQWGVLVPVVGPLKDATVADVVPLRQAAVERARSRRMSSRDSATVFATLSNLGTAGVSWFTGVVPWGQVALLTVGELTDRPAVEDGRLVVAPMLTAIVTADHRRYDGADSARLLSSFAQNLSVTSTGSRP